MKTTTSEKVALGSNHLVYVLLFSCRNTFQKLKQTQLEAAYSTVTWLLANYGVTTSTLSLICRIDETTQNQLRKTCLYMNPS